MSDHLPATIAQGDLRRLYAKINAHEAILRVLIHTLVDSAVDPADLFEQIRSVTMEEGEMFERTEGSPNVEFVEQGRVDTIAFIAETFAAVKAGRDDSND